MLALVRYSDLMLRKSLAILLLFSWVILSGIDLLEDLEFDSEAKRLGTVIRGFHVGLAVWRINAKSESHLLWQ